jgi:hypothetical protein
MARWNQRLYRFVLSKSCHLMNMLCYPVRPVNGLSGFVFDGAEWFLT